MLHSESSERPIQSRSMVASLPTTWSAWLRHMGLGNQPSVAGGLGGGELRFTVFVKIVLLGMLAAVLYAFFMGHFLQRGYPYNTFLVGVPDIFMDFFNVNYYSYDLNPYPTQVPYPPFALLLARGFACGFDYTTHGALAARASVPGLLSCLLLMGAFAAFFFAAAYRGVRTGRRGRDLGMALALTLSYPVLFLIDRGNYAVVAFACLFGFVHWYRSRPGLANLCLALAISVKIYPALFLLLLAADRRWRDCLWVVGLTAGLNLGALLFFEGGVLANARLFARNLLLFNKGMSKAAVDGAWNLSFTNLLRVPYELFLHRVPKRLLALSPLCILGMVAGLWYALRGDRPFWQRVLLVTVVQLQVPGYSADYNLVYLAIPLLLYFRQAGPLTRADYFFLGCAGLLFIPKPYYVVSVHGLHVMNAGAFINPLLLLALFARQVLPRAVKPLVAGGALVLLAGICCQVTRTSLWASNNAPPSLTMTGLSGDWVLKEGLTLTGPTDLLRRRPAIHLRGPNWSLARLGGRLPKVMATLVLPGQPSVRVPAWLVGKGEEYLLSVHLDQADLPRQRQAEIRLSFDRWFVPGKIGENEDNRPLVLPIPHSICLLPVRPPQARDDRGPAQAHKDAHGADSAQPSAEEAEGPGLN